MKIRHLNIVSDNWSTASSSSRLQRCLMINDHKDYLNARGMASCTSYSNILQIKIANFIPRH